VGYPALFLGTLVFREVTTVVGYAVFLAYERMEFRVLATFLFQILKFAATLPVVLLGWGLAPIFGAALIAEAARVCWPCGWCSSDSRGRF